MAVDYRLLWKTLIPVVSNFSVLSGVELGEQTYPRLTKSGAGSFGFFDLGEGFVLTMGKIEMFTEVQVRVNFIGNNKDYVFGDRKVEPEMAYPRFGINYRFK